MVSIIMNWIRNSVGLILEDRPDIKIHRLVIIIIIR